MILCKWLICTKNVLLLLHYTRLTALCLGLPRWASTRKVKPIWILQKQETVSGSGISWAVCKSAPRSRQTTTPAPHHSVFFTGRMPFLPPNQQRQSTEGTHKKCKSKYIFQVRYHYPHLAILPKNNIMYLYTPHTYITTLKDDLIKFNKISTKFQYGQCLLSVTGIVTISYNTSFKLLKLL